MYEWLDEKLFVYVHIYETYLAQIKIGSAFKNIHLMIFFSKEIFLVNRTRFLMREKNIFVTMVTENNILLIRIIEEKADK